MEPIATIVQALIAGAGAVSKETASDAVKNAYHELKADVVRNWGIGMDGYKADPQELELLLDKLDSEPEMSHIRVEKNLQKPCRHPPTNWWRKHNSYMTSWLKQD